MQGYLTKMPKDFVDRWPQLSSLEDSLAGFDERLAPLTEWGRPGPDTESQPAESLKIKNADDYMAFVKGGPQRRTQTHERLIASAIELLQELGAKVTTPHPIHLRLTRPREAIIEAKVVGWVSPILAVRAAVGQLLEYRKFIGPKHSDLCILLDADPGRALVEYVEVDLRFLIMWITNGALHLGPRTMGRLPTLRLV
ncbi:MAG: hypothetical protein C5B48_16220 [Candidatus Rokuibacteriota bacterium]|nr:MAG: hypothetical protein C5B48_16220 [Candidatus Rokubacteria bacterium]